MSDLLTQYGLREVADVVFYEINPDGTAGAPYLYLDTLKVTSMEQTAEQTEARGGKGNPVLVTWDYNKDITLSLEDALLSMKTLALQWGGGVVEEVAGTNTIVKTLRFTGPTAPTDWEDANGKTHAITSPEIFDGNGNTVESAALEEGTSYFIKFAVDVTGHQIVVSANTFPGTYYVVGDTFIRNAVTGKDEYFQFIVPKAKISSESTLTMEAEGNPSTFNMDLKVMRPENGEMVKLVKYDLAGE